MTDNIQKLYEIAGVRTCKREKGFTLKDCTDRNCKDCGYYSPFTAEKLLELIKWLSQNTYRNYFTVRYHFNEKYWICQCSFCQSYRTNNFENALASVVLALWQDLTEEQKQEIKRILE